MSKVVRIHEYGGPEQLRIEELDVGNPGPGEVRIRVEAIGLNRSEALFRAVVGPHMTNTDSTPFMDLVPAISVRENERGREIGAGWDPHWHQPTDVYTTFTEQDFRLGLNAAQTTLGAIGRLSGATLIRASRATVR
jgi:hypothetical protein